ncbi:Two-component system sensor histidine kinase ComP OS=Ureibacillus acetophenoni OX=614649 GN=SAMN05877842_102390 PE=4 SV=1 [Ureibacillus acetophenoni]
MISKKWFWSIIIFYLIIGTYIFWKGYQTPFVGIHVEKSNEEWVVSGFRHPEIADIYQINVGDFVIAICNEDIKKSEKLVYDHTIRFADKITIKTIDGQVRTIHFNHMDVPSHFMSDYILPLLYFLIALGIAIYLFIHKKGNKYSLNYLILFILTLSIACGSIPLYLRMNWFGTIINSVSIILTPILLIAFMKYYFQYLSIKWPFTNNIKWLYSFPIFIFILTILEKYIPSMYHVDSYIILVIFFILVLVNITIIVYAFIKYPKSQIKFLFWGIVIPILPFVLFYVVPLMLFNKFILSTSTLTIFFLFLAVGFIFAQFSERLYDVDYYISRLKYYSLFAIILTIVLCLGIYLLVSISILELISLSIFIFLVIIFSLYIKEYMDYTNRKVLFSPRGNYIHQLYSSIENIGKTVHLEELFNNISTILSKQLELDTVYVIGFNNKEKQFVENHTIQTKPIHQSLPTSLFDQLKLFEIKKTEECYVACIHQDVEMKHLLILGDSNHSSLKHEELLTLELLILYVTNFIDNTKLVEELLTKLNTMEKEEHGHPFWFEKLILLKLEEEKNHLAQDLHDTVLQEQIFLIREMDTVLHEHNTLQLQEKVADFHHQLMTINHQLREYCEILKPPLLDTLGLNAALNKLFIQTKRRAEFTLLHKIENIDTTDKFVPLLIYRFIQELLTNAIKHSNATYVKVQLSKYNKGFEIMYMDNGIGFDPSILKNTESMGIAGIRERVHTYKGDFIIDTYPDEGTQIRIRVGDVEND